MKKIISSFTLALSCLFAFAQTFDIVSVSVAPANEYDSIEVTLVTTLPGGPCSIYGVYPSSWAGDTVVVDIIYCYESSGPACTTTNTITLDTVLAAGTYTVRAKLLTSDVPTPGACGSVGFSLKDIGFQGFTITNLPTSINDATQLEVRISPNPVTDNVHFSFTRNGAAEITLLDLSGKTVKNSTFQLGAEMMLNVADLPANVYFYTIKTTGQTTSGKILVK
jgi:hypothetical protein